MCKVNREAGAGYRDTPLPAQGSGAASGEPYPNVPNKKTGPKRAGLTRGAISTPGCSSGYLYCALMAPHVLSSVPTPQRMFAVMQHTSNSSPLLAPQRKSG
jgi:hypothetical protein